MAINNGTPNPLNYFKVRRVEFAPPHFTFFTVNQFMPRQVIAITEWIEDNLSGRFYISQGITLDNTNTIVYNTRIGFESEQEVTFFILACPFIHM